MTESGEAGVSRFEDALVARGTTHFELTLVVSGASDLSRTVSVLAALGLPASPTPEA